MVTMWIIVLKGRRVEEGSEEESKAMEDRGMLIQVGLWYHENVKKNHHTFEWWEFCIYIVIYRLYTDCIT